MEDEDVEEQTVAYQRCMSEEHDITGPYREQIIAALRETAREVFGYVDDLSNLKVRPFVPSHSAGYEAPRFRAGILGDIYRSNPVLMGEREDVVELVFNDRTERVSARTWDYMESWKDSMDRWKGSQDQACCKIYMIREPLKLRTITAGTPSLYGALQPILDHMREGMSRFEVFRLTRQENNAAWLSGRLNTVPQGPTKDLNMWKRQWKLTNSGDYQQSTNDLSMEVTRTICTWAFGGDVERVVAKALGPQRLISEGQTLTSVKYERLRDGVYKRKEEFASTEVESEQLNGQLMGSPLSFPVLCVANAALKRLAYQIAYNRWWGKSLDFFPFAVNGDDIVARLDLRVYDIWVQLLTAVNWKLSPGKSYLDERLAQVNSQTMRVGWIGDELWLSNPLPFVNSGFLQQMKKSCNQIDSAPLSDMSLDWSRRWESIDRLPAKMQVRARQIMATNLDALCMRLYENEWTPFLLKPGNPVGLGGLGLSGYGKFCPKTAWSGLNSKPIKPESLYAMCQRTPYDTELAMPYLTMTSKRKFTREALLDALLDDLDAYVISQTYPSIDSLKGHVDPESRTIKRVAEGHVSVRLLKAPKLWLDASVMVRPTDIDKAARRREVSSFDAVPLSTEIPIVDENNNKKAARTFESVYVPAWDFRGKGDRFVRSFLRGLN